MNKELAVNIPEETDMNVNDIQHSGKWVKPIPITTTLLPVAPLTPDMIPKPFRSWLLDIANRMRCPLDYVAAAMVVVISSLIGTRLTIKPKEKDDWTVFANLWGAVIGDPSSLKTPALNEVSKPLKRLIAESRTQYESDLHTYEAAMVTYEAQKRVYQTQEQDRLKGKLVINPVSYPESPLKPSERRYTTNDATVEKLGELLNENPQGLLVQRDELIGLLASWDRMGHEQDRAFYLEAWNGNGSMTIDRIGRGTVHVKNVCLSLLGGIQPSKLIGYLQAATGYDNDGFVQRLQCAVYPDLADWTYIDQYPDATAREKAYQVIKTLAELDVPAIGYNSDDFNPAPYTHFSKDAQPIFKNWLIYWETTVLPNESGLLLEHFAKYRSLMPSLALIFHVIDHAGNLTQANDNDKHLVSKEAAEMAVRWCDYLASHARRIYGLLDTMHLTAAKELLRHLNKGDLKDGFKLRDISRKHWTHLIHRDHIHGAIEELIERHWLKEVQPEPKVIGRPEAPFYLINPQINQFKP